MKRNQILKLIAEAEKEHVNALPFSKQYVYAVPVDKPEGIEMMGGNFVYLCDSRFSRDVAAGPIPVHDRFESN